MVPVVNLPGAVTPTAHLFLIRFGLGVAADAREHNAAKIGFEQAMGLGQGIVQFGAFFKFAAIDLRLAQHLLGGFAALGPHRIEFKNNSGCPANR